MNGYLNFIKGLLILSFTHESPYDGIPDQGKFEPPVDLA